MFLPLFFFGFVNASDGITAIDEEPVVLKRVEAIYPKEAYEEKIEGQVVVAVRVGDTGVVETARVVKCENEIFNKAAVEAAKQWLFKPVIQNEKPIKFWYNIPMAFYLWKKTYLNANTKPNIESPKDSVSISKTKEQNEAGVRIDIPMDLTLDTTAIVFAKPPFDEKPILIQRIEPEYPAIARINKIWGRVVLGLLVDSVGRVEKNIILEGSNEIFYESAITATKQYFFKPAIYNQKPTKAWYIDSVIFRVK